MRHEPHAICRCRSIMATLFAREVSGGDSGPFGSFSGTGPRPRADPCAAQAHGCVYGNAGFEIFFVWGDDDGSRRGCIVLKVEAHGKGATSSADVMGMALRLGRTRTASREFAQKTSRDLAYAVGRCHGPRDWPPAVAGQLTFVRGAHAWRRGHRSRGDRRSGSGVFTESWKPGSSPGGWLIMSHFFSSRINHDLANFQSRITVSLEMSSAGGGLFHCEPAKEAKFDNTPLAFVERGQRPESLLQSQDVCALVNERQIFLYSHPYRAAATLLIRAGSRGIDQDAPHEARRHREKVRPVLPVHLSDVDQPNKCLIDECRRLQRVPLTLIAHATPRDALQLGFDDRHEPV